MRPRPDGAPGRSRRPSLRAILVALLLSTVAVMCLVIGAVTHLSVRGQLSSQLDQQLARASERALRTGPGDSSGSQPSGGDGNAPGTGEFELGARIQNGRLVRADWRDREGEVRSLGAADAQTVLDAASSPAATSGPTDVDLSIGHYRILVHHSPGGEQAVTGLPLAPMRSTLTRLDLTLLAASLGALAVTGVAGSLIVRRTMRPLEEVSRLASEVASMELERGTVRLAERIPAARARPGTEVGEVSRALNHLLDNVEDALATRQRNEVRMRRFIADASHELRTPLTAIRGYTEMLRMTEDLSDRGAQSVARLDAQSRRMTSLVEDLLLLTRLDDGAPRAAEEVDLGEVVLEAGMDAQVTGPGHTWTLDVPDEPVVVRGDPRQLTQVVVNLLSNARKHTPEGTAVRVRLRRGTGPGGREQAVLTVLDDGPGIAPDLVGEVFSRFTRADAARSGPDPTTGLGLSIVRAILEAHGGGIEVESRPGRTRFTVRLPLAATTP